MRRFTRDVALFTLLQLLIGTALAWGYRIDPAHYMCALIDKHQRLRSTDPPRLVFVGGSNLAFGIDSPRLERELGRPTVNMGLHVGLGLDYMLREAEAELRPGDAVVVSAEYHLFGEEIGSVILFPVLELRPGAIAELSLRQIGILLDSALIYLGRVVRSGVRGSLGLLPAIDPEAAAPYCRPSFNRHGDIVAHLGMAQRRVQPDLHSGAFDAGNAAATIAELNAFHARCRTRDIDVFYQHPPIPEPHQELFAPTVSRVLAAMRASCTIPQLHGGAAPAYPVAHFFDSSYHLHRGGVARRTAELIAELRARGIGH